MKLRNRNLILVLAGAAALALAACGSTSKSSGGGSSEGEGEGEGAAEGEGEGAAEGEGEGAAEGEGEGGVPAENTASGTIEDESGTETSFEQAEPEPKQGVFAASVDGGQVLLTIATADEAGASVLACFLETGGTVLPGSITVGTTEDDSYCTLTETTPMPGVFNSTGGKVEFTSCPTATGEGLSGRFVNVTFEQETGGVGEAGTRTLNGAFNIDLMAVNESAVECAAAEGEGEGPAEGEGEGPAEGEGEGPAEGEGEGGGSCPWNEDNVCQTEGQAPCCAYINCIGPCMAGCEMDCVASPDPMCAFGCVMDCAQNCQAKITPTCEPLMEAADECSEDAGCNDIEDEDASFECDLENCCEEYGAALGG